MLSETDIHYITGFLYLTSGGADTSVILGERVHDEASETKRDVDIVIAVAGNSSLVGVEVKDESRPLDVAIVEGICQKFTDMPAITKRTIVSASGFTKPAIRKAAAHGVQCLRIVRGKLPDSSEMGIEFADLQMVQLKWHEGPDVHFLPAPKVSTSMEAHFHIDLPVLYEILSSEDILKTWKELALQIVDQAEAACRTLSTIVKPLTIELSFQLERRPYVKTPDGPMFVTKARVTGVVEWINMEIPDSENCYLESMDGKAVSNTIILALPSGLFGVAIDGPSQQMRLYHIPTARRLKRPFKVELPRDS